jgi:hypothetical protein
MERRQELVRIAAEELLELHAAGADDQGYGSGMAPSEGLEPARLGGPAALDLDGPQGVGPAHDIVDLVVSLSPVRHFVGEALQVVEEVRADGVFDEASPVRSVAPRLLE